MEMSELYSRGVYNANAKQAGDLSLSDFSWRDRAQCR
jgi:sporulation protein YlmC with PRC-barrel domain